MISEKLFDALNEQVNFELQSEYSYLAMSAYCEGEDFQGFANFFKVQAQEERFHAMKIYDYIFQMGGRVTLKEMPAPQTDFSGIMDVFIEGYKHEQEVTRRIYSISDIASEEREHATISFLKWFIDEQVEEEDTFNNIIKKLKRIENNAAALYMLDNELAARVFTPPTAQI